jgi:D-tyrosyl-tRNA(Tyr) deacylase
MRAVIQRVSQAQVQVAQDIVGAIGAGLVALVGIHRADTDKDIAWMAEKIKHLRIFDDQAGCMNCSLAETGGQLLVVSQFTLLGDCRKGRRPSWQEAAPPEQAKQFYEHFLDRCRQQGIPTQAGIFQADMHVVLCNDGPVTILLDSHKNF